MQRILENEIQNIEFSPSNEKKTLKKMESKWNMHFSQTRNKYGN